MEGVLVGVGGEPLGIISGGREGGGMRHVGDCEVARVGERKDEFIFS